MKQTRFTKLAALLLAFALLLGVVFSFGASAITAEEITGTASITSVNVEHRAFMHLAFQVSAPDATGTVGIMIWESDVTNYTIENAIYSNYETLKDSENNVYYSSQPIAAKNIATEYQVAVVEKDAEGNVTIISAPAKQSIEGWATTKLGQNPDANRETLYKAVIAYGKAASAVLSK